MNLNDVGFFLVRNWISNAETAHLHRPEYL